MTQNLDDVTVPKEGTLTTVPLEKENEQFVNDRVIIARSKPPVHEATKGLKV